MKYTAEKRKVNRTGLADAGWQLGKGYVKHSATVTTEKWCLVQHDKILSECRSERVAKELAEQLNASSVLVRMQSVDYELLKEQKAWLEGYESTPEADGLWELLGHLQDAAVSDGIPESKVYP